MDARRGPKVLNNVLRNLNKESFLLMYLADELSAEDRRAVEQMLMADAGLQGELDELAETSDGFVATMARLDASHLPNQVAVTRRIGAAMRQRLADQAAVAESAPVVARPSSRYPIWAYPAMTAAAAAVLFLSWWGHQPAGIMRMPAADPYVAFKLPSVPSFPMTASSDTDGSAGELALDEEVEHIFEQGNPAQSRTAVASLEAAEEQVAELSRRGTELSQTPGLQDSNE